jgi:hypothetical protein
MADRYWVGGTGTWSNTNTANWSATSGGAGGASVPTTTDTPLFDANSGTGTVTRTSSLTVGQIDINNAGITLSLGGALTLNAVADSISVTNGTFTTNNYAVTAGNIVTGTGGTSRTINLGSSTVTLYNTAAAIGFTDSNGFTFNAGTSQINCTATSSAFNGGGNTFYNVALTNVAKASWTVAGTNTFNNLSVTGRTSVGISVINFSANQTINGTLTLSAGTNATARTFVRSNTIGTTRTLTCAAVTATDIDFRDITIAGAAAPVSGTRLGDCKGNSGITFPAARTVYFGTETGANWGGALWNTTNASGGGGAVNDFPLAQDTAVLGVEPNSNTTVTINAAYNIGTIDMSARTSNTMTLATGTTTPAIYGNWINGTGTTISGTGVITFAGRGSQTITSAGKTFTQPVLINSPSGLVTLQDAFVTNSTSTNFTAGTFDANGYNVTRSGGTFGSTGTLTRTVAIGTGTWTTSAAGNTWLVSGSNLTVTGTGTISLTSASAKTFTGGDIQTYPTINQGGTGALTITGSNKFANITNTAIGSVLFTGGTTNEFTVFNLNGTSTAARLTLGSTNTTQVTLRKPSAWNVGTGSLDSGNNTGLSFTAGSNNFLNISYVIGVDTSTLSSTVYYGSTNVTVLYYGSTPVTSVYYGSTQVF